MLIISCLHLHKKNKPQVKFKIFKIMKTSNQKVAESKVGVITKTFSNASSIVWNSKRRYK
jgi:hypothetical protein